MGNENFTGRPQAIVRGSSPGKKRGCQRGRVPNSGGGGQSRQIGNRGVIRGRVAKSPTRPSPRVLHLKRHQQEPAQRPRAPRQILPQRGTRPQAPEARAERLRSSPRRRHTKSQNGCPKEARTAQPVRSG